LQAPTDMISAHHAAATVEKYQALFSMSTGIIWNISICS